jgi:hypothetical protein
VSSKNTQTSRPTIRNTITGTGIRSSSTKSNRCRPSHKKAAKRRLRPPRRRAGHAGGNGAPLGGNALQADEQEHHAECGQQIRHAHFHDQQTVDQAHERAHHQAGKHGDKGRLFQHHHHVGRQHQRRCCDRADGKIETADDQRAGDAESQNAGDRHRLENEGRRARPGKPVGEARRRRSPAQQQGTKSRSGWRGSISVATGLRFWRGAALLRGWRFAVSVHAHAYASCGLPDLPAWTRLLG